MMPLTRESINEHFTATQPIKQLDVMSNTPDTSNSEGTTAGANEGTRKRKPLLELL
jgi:hypothetical protein